MKVGDKVRLNENYLGVAVGSEGDVEKVFELEGDHFAKVVLGENLSGQRLKKTIPFEYLEVIPNTTYKKYDLGFGSMGNGTVVWNRLDYDAKSDDYKRVAIISISGITPKIDYYEDNLPPEVIKEIELHAKSMVKLSKIDDNIFWRVNNSSATQGVIEFYDKDNNLLASYAYNPMSDDVNERASFFKGFYYKMVELAKEIQSNGFLVSERELIQMPSTERRELEAKYLPTPKHEIRKTAYHWVYDRLTGKIAPNLIDLLENYDYPTDVYGKSQFRTDDFGGDDSFMHLAIEGLEKDDKGRYIISMSHYYVQHGDMMCDPCMTVRLDVSQGIAEAMSFKMDGVIGRGIVKEVYGLTRDGKEGVNLSEKKSQNSFLNTWTSNLVKQKHLVEFREVEPNETVKELISLISNEEKFKDGQVKNEKGLAPTLQLAIRYSSKDDAQIDIDKYKIPNAYSFHASGSESSVELDLNRNPLRKGWYIRGGDNKDVITNGMLNSYRHKSRVDSNAIIAGDIVGRKSGGTVKYEVVRLYGDKIDAIVTTNGVEFEGMPLSDFKKLSGQEREEGRAELEKVRSIINIDSQKEKYPIVLEWSEGIDVENKGFESIEELESFLKQVDYKNIPKDTYVKNKVSFTKSPNSRLTVYMSEGENDWNPERESLIEWLNGYEKGDWKNYSKYQTIDDVLNDDDLGILDSPKISKEEQEIVDAFAKPISEAIKKAEDKTEAFPIGTRITTEVSPVHDETYTIESSEYYKYLNDWVYELSSGSSMNHKDLLKLIGDGKSTIELPEGATVKTESSFSNFKGLDPNDYKNQFELNKAIEEFLDSKSEDYIFGIPEKDFVYQYAGYGGLEKQGATAEEHGTGLLWEYFTPKELIEKMWGLAYKYGFNTGKVLEPSVGVGRVLDFASESDTVVGYEISKYSKRICNIIHPKADIRLSSFSQHFYNRNTYDPKFEKDFDLVIGNPPYGKNVDLRSDAESKRLKAPIAQFEHYFILRGLDCLKSGGLLVYVSTANLFTKGYESVKERIAEKADLVDGYLLPNKTFKTTEIGTSIIVLRRK